MHTADSHVSLERTRRLSEGEGSAAHLPDLGSGDRALAMEADPIAAVRAALLAVGRPNQETPNGSVAAHVQLARAFLALGSVRRARDAYASAYAHAALPERGAIDEERSQLDLLVSDWIDHPMRLCNLFSRVPRHLTPPVSAEVTRTDVSMVELSVSVFVGNGPPPRGIALYFHGNGECADDLAHVAPRFHRVGLVLAVVEMRGYGARSEEAPLLSAMLHDSERLLDDDCMSALLAAAGGLPRSTPLICYGRSIGGHVAMHLCACALALDSAVSISGLVLDSAVASVRHWTAELPHDDGGDSAGRPRVPGGLRTVGLLENRAKLSGMCAHAASPLPTLILHGSADALVPPFQASLLARCAPHATLLVLSGRGHNDLMHAPEYWPAVADLAGRAFEYVGYKT